MAYDEFKSEREYDAARKEEVIWRKAKELGMSRRKLLGLLASAGAGAFLSACTSQVPAPAPQGASTNASSATTPPPGAKVEPPKPKAFVKSITAENFLIHDSNAEMRWDKLFNTGYVTPNDLFFVRNHTTTPAIDIKNWRLKIEGSGVAKPLELTYDDLLSMPSTSVIRHIECTGNGRSFFKEAHGKQAKGTQWKLGAIGVAEWTGVPLREIFERAGIKKTAKDFMPEGLDMQKVRRPMPVSRAMDNEDWILVYAMNGQPLPPDHGFPVRTLVPGYIGVGNIKWVGRIEVSDEALYSPWNTDSYVLIGPDYKAEGKVKGPGISEGTLKSALELGWPGEVAAGMRAIRGRAWSPAGKIAKVEYSIDGGPWQQAKLIGLNIEKAWARFEFHWDAKPGDHKIKVRATDDKGNTQPDSVKYNDLGYLYNAVVEHPVKVK